MLLPKNSMLRPTYKSALLFGQEACSNQALSLYTQSVNVDVVFGDFVNFTKNWVEVKIVNVNCRIHCGQAKILSTKFRSRCDYNFINPKHMYTAIYNLIKGNINCELCLGYPLAT